MDDTKESQWKQTLPSLIISANSLQINPAFNGNDPIYRNAFTKLNNDVKGLANSKFHSSVWKENFSRSLRARPDCYTEDIGLDTEEEGRKCDACGRSKHPAKHTMRFAGTAYHHDTLEDLYDHSDDEDDDNKSVNSNGFTIPSEEEVYYVGR